MKQGKIIILAVLLLALIIATIVIGLWLEGDSNERKGLTLIPDVTSESTEDEKNPVPLIQYSAIDESEYQPYLKSINQFLNEYKNIKPEPIQCNSYLKPIENIGCKVDTINLGPCTKENDYDFPRAKPCIFFKWQAIEDWEPEYYNSSIGLPVNMPWYLKTHIKHQEEAKGVNPKELNQVWITCGGDTPIDEGNLGGTTLYPKQGIPGYFFPYTEQDGYKDPFVAVHFGNLKPNVLIKVKCNAWAKNIPVDDQGKSLGEISFDLLVNK